MLEKPDIYLSKNKFTQKNLISSVFQRKCYNIALIHRKHDLPA